MSSPSWPPINREWQRNLRRSRIFWEAILGPLDRAQIKLQQAYALVNQSPLGSGAMVSTGLPIDRAEAAANAGFDGVIENTFDAVAAVDHLAAVSETLRAVTRPIARFMHETAILYRTDPSSLILHDASPQVRSELPQHTVIPAFDELARLAIDLDAVLGTDRSLDRPCATRTAGGDGNSARDDSNWHSSWQAS